MTVPEQQRQHESVSETTIATATDVSTTSLSVSDGIVWDIMIVGAGVAGCSAAYQCYKKADSVSSMLILDAGPDAGEG
jgi:ribulose 1,5-bisphosphate synthetase/thiazole synthase